MGRPMEHVRSQIKVHVDQITYHNFSDDCDDYQQQSPLHDTKGYLKHSQSPSFESTLENLSGHPDSDANAAQHHACTTLHEWATRTNGAASSLMVPVLKTAFKLYHISLLLNHPFPMPDDNESYVTRTLSDAFQEHCMVNVSITEDMVMTVQAKHNSSSHI